MKTNWQTKKLGEICEVIAGQSPEGKFYNKVGNGLPFYQGKKEFTKKFIGTPTTWTTKITKEARRGDILISVRAPVGAINFATERICIGRGLAAIRVGKEIDENFLFNYLKFIENEIVGNAGAVFNSISKTQIEKIEIPLPSLPEQKRIVKILDDVFEKTAMARENTEKNLQNSRELFESYLNGVFANPGKDWEEKQIKEVCEELFAGGDVPKNYSKVKTKDYTVPIFANGIQNKGLYGYTNIKKVVKPSITVSARGTIGYSEIRQEPFFPIVRLIVLVPDPKVIGLPFLYYITRSFQFSNTGSSIPQLTIPMIQNIKIKLPPSLDEQKTIVKKLDSLSEHTKKLGKNYQQKLYDLAELKKSVLSKAFAQTL